MKKGDILFSIAVLMIILLAFIPLFILVVDILTPSNFLSDIQREKLTIYLVIAYPWVVPLVGACLCYSFLPKK